ncbi:hypothetical protein [Kribbella sp. NPDC049584]|uniref:hypothetical protein n=1 Tax=Kribbella sp. NPDC049584 TaxID=3154833 RepID=UPI003449961C
MRRIVESLPRGADYVTSPDHPLLLRNPAILASVRGFLTAYFFVGRNSVSTADDRIMLARLALPAGTRIVVASEEFGSAVDNDSYLSDELVELASDRESLRVPSGPFRRSDSAELIDSVRWEHHERFAEAWAATQGVGQTVESTRGRRGRSTAALSLEDESNPRLFVRRHMVSDRLVVDGPPAPSRTRLGQRMSTAIENAVHLDYGLSRGLEGVRRYGSLLSSQDAHLALHHYFLSEVPQTRAFDELRPLRAAAFAGYVTHVMGA